MPLTKHLYHISLVTTTLAKILESLLNRTLNNHLNMNDTSFGFWSGMSKEIATLCLKHTVSLLL